MTARENIVASAFDGLVARLTDAAAHKQDFFQEAMAAALDITDLDSHLRFAIGDITCLIETAYGMDRMGEWAGAIKRSKKTCYSYAHVSRFYPIENRAAWLAEPALSWSHLRLAMRLKNADDAAAFLHDCANEALTVDGAAIELRQRMGQTMTPAALFNDTAMFEKHGGLWVIRGIEYTAIQEGVSYTVSIKPA